MKSAVIRGAMDSIPGEMQFFELSTGVSLALAILGRAGL